MSPTRIRLLLEATFTVIAICFAVPAAAQEAFAPTPRVVIYPGDVIRDDMLADAPEVARDGSGQFVEQRSLIVGKVADSPCFRAMRSPFPVFPTAKLSPTERRSSWSIPMADWSS